MGKYDIPQLPAKRLRYFNNQFLNERDFIDDQAAHLAHERAHLRALCSPGVLEGLVVTPGDAGAALQISAGVAVDKNGRLIVLDPATTGPAPSGLAAGSYVLYIQYSEIATDPAPGSDNTRWTSQPVIGAVATPGSLPAAAVVLGSFTVSASQITAQSAAGRQYAGVRLPGPGIQVDPPVAATLTSNGSTNDGAVLAGTLAVRRDVSAALGPTLTLTNGASAAANSMAAIDFNVYDPGQNDPAVRVHALGDGNSSAALIVSTKTPGSVSNQLAERIRITALGETQVKGLLNASGGITVADGKHVTLSGSADLTVGGMLSANGGITVADGKHVTLSGSADLTMGGLLSANGGITVADGKHVTLSGSADLTVGGMLNANGGITVADGKHVTLSGSADLTVNGTTALKSTLKVGTGTGTASVAVTRFTSDSITSMSDSERQVTVPTSLAVKNYADGAASASPGRLLAVRSLTGSGAVPTATPGATRVRVRMIGGGGGGGGAAVTTTAVSTVAAGAGGSSGALLEVWIAPQGAISYGNYTCGNGGGGGSVSSSAASDGANGGDTTITINGSDYIARGGAGGAGMANSSPTAISSALARTPAAAAALPAAGLALRSGVYGPGGNGVIFSGVKIAGVGGSSEFGAGGPKGAAGVGFGGGGGGGEAIVGSNQVGGAGAPGCIVIEEYS